MIAVALEIDDDQVATLLHLADRKLQNLMAVDLTPSAPPARTGRPHGIPANASTTQGETHEV